MWNLKHGTDELTLQNRNGLTDMENRLVVAKEKEEGVEWLEGFGLVDANYYYIWNE